MALRCGVESHSSFGIQNKYQISDICIPITAVINFIKLSAILSEIYSLTWSPIHFLNHLSSYPGLYRGSRLIPLSFAAAVYCQTTNIYSLADNKSHLRCVILSTNFWGFFYFIFMTMCTKDYFIESHVLAVVSATCGILSHNCKLCEMFNRDNWCKTQVNWTQNPNNDRLEVTYGLLHTQTCMTPFRIRLSLQ